jgi:hypothetical protein
MHAMKLFKWILSAALAFSFAGCLDIDERLDVNKDGSGQLAMDIDMSQMIDMLQTMGMGKDELAKKGLQNMDTTILLKDVIETSTKLSEDKKAILRPGRVHIKLDMDAKVFRIHSMFPFRNQADLQKLYALQNDGSTLGNAKLFGNLGGDSSGGPGDINQFNGVFDYTCRDGLLSKKINKEKFDALKNDPQMAQVKQASQMGMELNYTSTLSLPRPVKKVDNPLLKLSEDKKTVTMKFNLIDMFDHPEQFEYTLEY